MYTPNPELEKLHREKEAAEKKIEQYKHQIQRLKNRKKYYEDGERAKRTHRLCNLGGTVESIAPQVKDLTRTEMTELMEYIFGLEEVKRAVSHMAITHISISTEQRRSRTLALFHLNVKQIKRSQGQSAIASAAYRAGEKLSSEYYGEIADYIHKGGVISSEILPPDHVPRDYADRETLWNAVEIVEHEKNA